MPLTSSTSNMSSAVLGVAGSSITSPSSVTYSYACAPGNVSALLGASTLACSRTLVSHRDKALAHFSLIRLMPRPSISKSTSLGLGSFSIRLTTLRR